MKINISSNPFKGDAAEGFEDALKNLAAILQADPNKLASRPSPKLPPDMLRPKIDMQSPDIDGNSSNNSSSGDKKKDQMKNGEGSAKSSQSQQPNPQNQGSGDSNQNQQSDQQGKSEKQSSQSSEQDKKAKEVADAIKKMEQTVAENEKNNRGWSLSEKQLADVRQRLSEIRKDVENVISDDAPISKESDAEKAEKVSQLIDAAKQEIDNLKQSEEIPDNAEKSINKTEARLKEIETFFDNPINQKNARADISVRKDRTRFRQLAADKDKADKTLPTLSIETIVRKIAMTLRSTYGKKVTRKSSYQYYNPRSKQLGYVAPGRYNEIKKDIPTIGFFFDMSGSWSGNEPKINAGNLLENELLKLQDDKIIKLQRYYFAVGCGKKGEPIGGGNSAEPIPYIRNLIEQGELDNVIVMTDSDPSGCIQNLKVPGFCWLVFADHENEYVIKSLSGKKGTSIVMLDYKNI